MSHLVVGANVPFLSLWLELCEATVQLSYLVPTSLKLSLFVYVQPVNHLLGLVCESLSQPCCQNTVLLQLKL